MKTTMRVMTCNIRTSYSKDGQNNWDNRKSLCLDIICSNEPDIVCFQEMSGDQRSFFESQLHGFSAVGTPDMPGGIDPVNTLFFKNSMFDLSSVGGYWLSKTPHIPGTKSWKSRCVRLVTWIRLERKASHQQLRLSNTHLDHISQKARVNQARMIVADSNVYPDDFPHIVTGDFNCDYLNPAMTVFRKGGFLDTYNTVHGTMNPGTTYHDFRGDGFDAEIGKMDWILAKGDIRAVDACIVRDQREGKYPSDHYFVTADLSFTKQ
jgi:endonuclease/exonuclease/phosphatase family metal-dependent hydrolase